MKREQILVRLDRDLLDEIEKFAFVKRSKSRTEAIDKLIRLGLDAANLPDFERDPLPNSESEEDE